MRVSSVNAAAEFLADLNSGVKDKKRLKIINVKGKLAVKGLKLTGNKKKDQKRIAKFKAKLKDKADRALVDAITTGPTAKVEAVMSDPNVTGAEFKGKDKDGNIVQKVDVGDLRVGGGAQTVGEAAMHEVIEAWWGAKGFDYGPAHITAIFSVGGLLQEGGGFANPSEEGKVTSVFILSRSYDRNGRITNTYEKTSLGIITPIPDESFAKGGGEIKLDGTVKKRETIDRAQAERLARTSRPVNIAP